MVPVYGAAGLQAQTYDCLYGLEGRPDYGRSLRHLCHLIDVVALSAIEYPIRLLALAEGASQVIHRHYKNVVFTIEHSTTPHDVYDEWVAMFGQGLDAFFPVAKTPIGNIGASICMEGNFPEEIDPDGTAWLGDLAVPLPQALSPAARHWLQHAMTRVDPTHNLTADATIVRQVVDAGYAAQTARFRQLHPDVNVRPQTVAGVPCQIVSPANPQPAAAL